MENCTWNIHLSISILSTYCHRVGYTKSVVLKQPGHEFREMRKEINRAVGKAGAAKRNSLFDNRFVARYLQKLHTDPDKLFDHNRW